MEEQTEQELMKRYIEFANQGHIVRILGLGRSMRPLLNGIVIAYILSKLRTRVG